MRANVSSYSSPDGFAENRRAANTWSDVEHLTSKRNTDIQLVTASEGQLAGGCSLVIESHLLRDSFRDARSAGWAARLQVAAGLFTSGAPPHTWPAGLTLAVGNRHLDSIIASRSRPYRFPCHHALAIRPPAFVKIAPAVLNSEYKFGLGRFRWVVVERKSIRILNDLSVGTSEQYVCSRVDMFNPIIAGRKTVACYPELKWNRCSSHRLFLCRSLPHQK